MSQTAYFEEMWRQEMRWQGNNADDVAVQKEVMIESYYFTVI